jgi:hypothetical protein
LYYFFCVSSFSSFHSFVSFREEKVSKMLRKGVPIRMQEKEALLRMQEKEAPPLIRQKEDRKGTEDLVASQMVDVEEATCEVDPFEQV